MKRVAMALVRFYRKYLSGLKPAPTCRFTPTCSAYALEAFEKRGFFAGLTLTLWRILRSCQPRAIRQTSNGLPLYRCNEPSG